MQPMYFYKFITTDENVGGRDSRRAADPDRTHFDFRGHSPTLKRILIGVPMTFPRSPWSMEIGGFPL